MVSRSRRQVTRADVARLAGVSESTVSYALSGVRSIGDDTRERILAAMDELGYTPNVMAQGLAGKRSTLLALLFPIGQRGFAPSDNEYVSSASRVAGDSGYQLLMWPNPYEDIEALQKIVAQRLIDGAIVMEVRQQDPRVSVLEQARVPYCLIGRTENPSSLTWVDADFSLWGPLAIDLLADAGHRSVAFITQSEEFFRSGYGPLVRTEPNLLARAAERGVTVHVRRLEATLLAGRQDFATWDSAGLGITAILGFNEFAMIGIAEAIKTSGKEIPRDFSIIEFGLTQELAQSMVVPPDTIGVDGSELGAKASEFLLQRLDGDLDSPLNYLAPPIHVSRGTIVPPPG